MTLVGGTLPAALPHLAAAALIPDANGLVTWRLHTQFEVDRPVPPRIDLTPDGGGDDERAVRDRTAASDRLYVMDRGYAQFALSNRAVDAKSSYVCRVRDNSVSAIAEASPLPDAARAERATRDAIIELGSPSSEKLAHRVRVIEVAAKPRNKATPSPGPGCDGVLRIASDLPDVPAEIVAVRYRYHWTIGISFRFFKQILGGRHPWSRSKDGIAIRTYCAILARLLINSWTGRKPTLRTREMICWYLLGLATLDELVAHLAKVKNAARKGEADRRTRTTRPSSRRAETNARLPSAQDNSAGIPGRNAHSEVARFHRRSGRPSCRTGSGRSPLRVRVLHDAVVWTAPRLAGARFRV